MIHSDNSCKDQNVPSCTQCQAEHFGLETPLFKINCLPEFLAQLLIKKFK